MQPMLSELEKALLDQQDALAAGDYEVAMNLAQVVSDLAEKCKFAAAPAPEDLARIAELQQAVMLQAASLKAQISAELVRVASSGKALKAYGAAAR